MQTINVKTRVKLTTARLENFFEQLRCGLRIYLDAEALTAALLGEKKVSINGKTFDIFDFTEAVQNLADTNLESFIDFLRDDFDTCTARKIFDLI